jgi:hypothetical protein
MANNPKVTVLMSAYNAERYVAEAVDSVLAQTFPDFEFLIFEDASTDRTREIFRSYSDPRIRVVENEANLGLTRNLQRGMLMACGEYVARMDADDVCMPQRLARQLEYLGAHPEIAVLGSAVTFFGEGREPFVGHQPVGHDAIKCALLYGFTMLHPTVMIRKKDFDRYGLNYDPAFPVSQDHDLWERAIRKVRFANVSETLLHLRMHAEKIGTVRNDQQRRYSDLIRSRQLAELGVSATPAEVRVLGEHGSPQATWTLADCQALEQLLLRIFESNKKSGVFDQGMLVGMGVAHFRGTCRHLLLNGNGAGRYYWRSRIRRLDVPTMRELVGLIWRSFGFGTVGRFC